MIKNIQIYPFFLILVIFIYEDKNKYNKRN